MFLQDKVAIITGAADGIGRAGAFLFAKERAKVVIADLNDEKGEKTIENLKEQGHEAIFVHTDRGGPRNSDRGWVIALL